ncbi:hypothetical protein ACQ4OD_01025 [Pseudomonas sp. WC1]|uniref:hypothetical protein n=1 Tax=Pseudomonas sp. WC1 TaxID=3424772 RepID=UPI003D354831
MTKLGVKKVVSMVTRGVVLGGTSLTVSNIKALLKQQGIIFLMLCLAGRYRHCEEQH